MEIKRKLTELTDFIEKERDRFEEAHNNMFATAFSKISRNYDYLVIIHDRYIDVSKKFVQNSVTLHESLKEGQKELSNIQETLLEESSTLTTAVHLEIESFYLFAKILLDVVARAFEFYFGQANRLSLDSHDDLVKNIEGYISAKALLAIPSSLRTKMHKLKQQVSDYRDYEIAHEKSPRTVKGTSFNTDGTGVNIINTRIYPTQKDVQKSSIELPIILSELSDFVSEVISYICSNNDKASLKSADVLD